MIVLFSGAHGTGKSTTIVDAVSSNPRVAEKFVIADSISEQFFNREDFKNPDLLVDKQKKFSQYQMGIWSGAHGDNVISSRSYADIWAYTKYQMNRDKDERYQEQLDEIEARCREAMESGNVTFFYFPILFDLVGKNLRSTNVEFQREIDNLIVEFFQKMNINPIVMEFADREIRTETVLGALGYHA